MPYNTHYGVYMSVHRVNITLPRGLVARLKGKTNKSAFIAEAVAEKLDAEDKERKSRELAAAYRQSALEGAELIRDWDGLAGEGL